MLSTLINWFAIVGFPAAILSQIFQRDLILDQRLVALRSRKRNLVASLNEEGFFWGEAHNYQGGEDGRSNH